MNVTLATAVLSVFLEQLGLPVPAMPTLILAGALVRKGLIHGWSVLAASLLATLVADALWFAVGRRFGERALRLVHILSPGAGGAWSKSVLKRVPQWMLLFAKFIPVISAISIPLAASSGMRFGTFLLLDAGGALLWAGSGILAGALFHRQVDTVLTFVGRLGWTAGLIGLGVLGILALVRLGPSVLRTIRVWAAQFGRLGWEALLFVPLAASVVAPVARAQEIVLSVGEYDAARRSSPAQQFAVAYRPERSLEGFRSEVGVMYVGAGAAYAHVAVFRDVPIGDLITLRPSLGVGAYRQGGGKDLGHPLEFRSGLEIGVPVRGGRVGVELFHLSNAHLASHNPGEESVAVAYTLPVGVLTALGAHGPRS